MAEHANFEYMDDQAEALPLPGEQLDTFEDEEVDTEEIPDESTKGFKKVSKYSTSLSVKTLPVMSPCH